MSKKEESLRESVFWFAKTKHWVLAEWSVVDRVLCVLNIYHYRYRYSTPEIKPHTTNTLSLYARTTSPNRTALSIFYYVQ